MPGHPLGLRSLYLRNRPVLREVIIIGFSVFLGLFTLLFVMLVVTPLAADAKGSRQERVPGPDMIA